jgi:LysR family transcriptional regulator, glycine cleavage system transcriptional activator
MASRLPPLNSLHAFEVAARHLSFTRAADELNVTQGAVSHRIRALEERLGRPLFRRDGRAMALTEAGEDYLPYVRRAFEQLIDGTDRVFNASGLDVLTVTLLPSFAMQWMIPRLRDFHETHADIEVHLITTDRVIDLTREDVDLAVRMGLGNEFRGLHADRLFAYDLVPVCSPQLLKGKHPLKQPADLARHSLIHVEPDVEDWTQWLTAAGVEGIAAEQGSYFDNASLAIAAAYSGLGVAVMPHAFVQDDIDDGFLVTPFDFTYEYEDAFFLVCPQASAQRPKIEAFRNWLLGEAAKEDASQRQRRGG